MNGIINIKSSDGTTLLTTSINEGAKGYFSLMQHDYIVLPLKLSSPIDFKIGSYVDLRGVFDEALGGKLSKIYYVTEKQTPTYNTDTGAYEYQLRLNAYYWLWNNFIFKYTPENTAGEASWSLTASLDVQMGVFLRNLKALGFSFNGEDYEVEIDSTVENKAVAMTYDNIHLLDALFSMGGEDAWNCDVWITEKVIHFGRLEQGDTVKIEQDVEASNMTRNKSKGSFATRIYAFGAERNIPVNYRPTDDSMTVNGIVQKRLMLPEDTPYIDAYPGMDSKEVVEGVVVFDNIYPRRMGMLSDVKTVDRALEGEDGQQESTFKAYQYKDSGLTFDESYVIEGKELRIVFQSGKLNGLDFGVTFNPNNANPAEQLWEIVANENYGRLLPDEVIKPENGDEYILYGFDIQLVSDQYIPNAEQELKEAAEKYVEKSKIDDGTYTVPLRASWVKADQINRTFDAGQRIRLVNPAFFPEEGRVSRIIGWEMFLDIPYDSPSYTIGESAQYSRLGNIEDKIETIGYKGSVYSGIGGGSGVYLIKTNDSTPASNSNVFSALRSLATFLRKDKEDSTDFLITFLKGIVLGLYKESQSGAKIDETGAAELASLVLRAGLQSAGFASGTLGTGYKLGFTDKGNSYLEIDEIFVRKIMEVVRLVIAEVKSIGGQFIISGTSITCTRVEEMTDTYRCYFNADDGEKAIENQFVVGDQARCQTFNIKAGVYENVSNTYYWRLVTAVGSNYIDLSKTDCDENSGIPKAGDEIVQLGNRTDTARQGAIILSAYGDDAPYIKMYRGIDSYILTGKEFFNVSRTTVNIIADSLKFSTGESVKEYIDNAIGAAKEGFYYLDLDNDSATIACDSEGNVTGTYPTSNATVYHGTEKDTGWTFAGTFMECAGSVDSSTGAVKITSMSADDASVTIKGTKKDCPTLTAVFSISKVRQGIQGIPGLQGLQGEQGLQGVPGEKGEDGKTSYFHIKYSSVENPTSSSQMTETPSTYIGTYVDFTQTDSTDPTKYTWARFEGIQGKQGEQGIPGTNGTDGKTYYFHIAYANSADGSQGFSITDSVNKLYIGQYTDTTQADSTDYKKYSWTKIKGEPGKDGKGIKSIANKYAVSSSYSSAPTSWSDSVPTMTATNRYLWNYEIITYTDNSTSETEKRVIGVYGNTGNPGNGIKSITEYYLASASASGVTTSTSGWTTTVQTTSTSKRYLWNYEVVNYTDGTKYTSSPVIIGTYGDTGAAAVQYSIETSVSVVKRAFSGTLSPTTVSCKKYKTTGNTARVETTEKTLKYQRVGQDSAEQNYSAAVTVTAATTGIYFRLYDGSTLLDSEYVPVLQDAEDLQIGGRNLLMKTNQGTTNWAASDPSGVYPISEWEDGIELDVTETTADWFVLSYSLGGTLPLLEPNTRYKLSFDGWCNKNANRTVVMQQSNGVNAISNWITLDFEANKTIHFEKSLITTDLSSLTNQVLYFVGMNRDLARYRIKNLKLEKGTIATAWTPAPEDIQSDLDKYKTEVSAKFEATNEAITASVKQSTTYTDGRISTVTSQLTTQAGQISGIVKEIDSINKTITTSGWITKADGQELFAKKEMENGETIISTINQTATTVKISAEKIELTGKVTFSMLASDAQDKINTAQSTADSANTAAGNAASAASKAQSTADAAKTAASNAQTTATTANTNAGKAQSTANNALTTANAAKKQIYHQAGGTSGTKGYVKIATLKISGQYQNRPIYFSLANRGREQTGLWILFSNTITKDPSLSQIQAEGGIEAWIHKSATSTWDVIAQKSESYDTIYVNDFANNNSNIDVTWTNEQLSAVPAGATAASSRYGSLAKKNKVEVAELGTTIIEGGHIVTSLIDVDSLFAKEVTTGNIVVTNGAKIGDFTINSGGLYYNSNKKNIRLSLDGYFYSQAYSTGYVQAGIGEGNATILENMQNDYNYNYKTNKLMTVGVGIRTILDSGRSHGVGMNSSAKDAGALVITTGGGYNSTYGRQIGISVITENGDKDYALSLWGRIKVSGRKAFTGTVTFRDGNDNWMSLEFVDGILVKQSY